MATYKLDWWKKCRWTGSWICDRRYYDRGSFEPCVVWSARFGACGFDGRGLMRMHLIINQLVQSCSRTIIGWVTCGYLEWNLNFYDLIKLYVYERNKTIAANFSSRFMISCLQMIENVRDCKRMHKTKCDNNIIIKRNKDRRILKACKKISLRMTELNGMEWQSTE